MTHADIAGYRARRRRWHAAGLSPELADILAAEGACDEAAIRRIGRQNWSRTPGITAQMLHQLDGLLRRDWGQAAAVADAGRVRICGMR